MTYITLLKIECISKIFDLRHFFQNLLENGDAVTGEKVRKSTFRILPSCQKDICSYISATIHTGLVIFWTSFILTD